MEIKEFSILGALIILIGLYAVINGYFMPAFVILGYGASIIFTSEKEIRIFDQPGPVVIGLIFFFFSLNEIISANLWGWAYFVLSSLPGGLMELRPHLKKSLTRKSGITADSLLFLGIFVVILFLHGYLSPERINSYAQAIKNLTDTLSQMVIFAVGLGVVIVLVIVITNGNRNDNFIIHNPRTQDGRKQHLDENDVDCERCQGLGGTETRCARCSGSGSLNNRNAFGSRSYNPMTKSMNPASVRCDACGGTGRVYLHCPVCGR